MRYWISIYAHTPNGRIYMGDAHFEAADQNEANDKAFWEAEKLIPDELYHTGIGVDWKYSAPIKITIPKELHAKLASRRKQEGRHSLYKLEGRNGAAYNYTEAHVLG